MEDGYINLTELIHSLLEMDYDERLKLMYEIEEAAMEGRLTMLNYFILLDTINN